MGKMPPRNQFSLIKTLLWMAAVAGYLGLCSAISSSRIQFAEMVAFFVVITTIRVAFGTAVAAFGSLLTCGHGLFVFVLVECTFRVIDKVDARIADRQVDEQWGYEGIASHRRLVGDGMLVSFFAVLLGGALISLVPATNLIEVWEAPKGTAICVSTPRAFAIAVGSGLVPLIAIFAFLMACWDLFRLVVFGRPESTPAIRRRASRRRRYGERGASDSETNRAPTTVPMALLLVCFALLCVVISLLPGILVLSRNMVAADRVVTVELSPFADALLGPKE